MANLSQKVFVALTMRRNVLIIEDEPVIAEMISMLLEEEGFEVVSLGNTGRAREKLHNLEVDLVMLDINLDGESGQEMCCYIKSQDDICHIPVILVSGHPDIEKIRAGCGADDTISKPFDLDYFMGKVNHFAA